MKLYLITIFTILSMFFSLTSKAQYQFGLSDLSVSVTDVKHGLPFFMIAPVHPGIEISTAFLKKDKEKAFHAFEATLGYYYHSLIAHAPYINLKLNAKTQQIGTTFLNLRLMMIPYQCFILRLQAQPTYL